MRDIVTLIYKIPQALEYIMPTKTQPLSQYLLSLLSIMFSKLG